MDKIYWLTSTTDGVIEQSPAHEEFTIELILMLSSS